MIIFKQGYIHMTSNQFLLKIGHGIVRCHNLTAHMMEDSRPTIDTDEITEVYDMDPHSFEPR